MDRRIMLSACVLVVLISTSATRVGAVVLFESAPFNDEFARFGGTGVASNQFLGHRFHLDSRVAVERIGVTLSDFDGVVVGNGKVFAAVVALEGESDFPDSASLSTPDVLGAALLDAPVGEVGIESVADLDLNLLPGWYAIVSGSGLFGATGRAAASFIPFEERPNPISWSFPDSGVWENVDSFASVNGNLLTSRMFIEGAVSETAPIPEPITATYTLLATIACTCVAVKRRVLVG